MDFKRNFPLNIVNEAQAASTLITAGLPKRIVYGLLSFVDDVDEVMEEIENEKDESMAAQYDEIIKSLPRGSISDQDNETDDTEDNGE